MSIGILPAGLFESRTVRQKRISETDAMFSKIGSNNQCFGHLELAVDGGLSYEVEELYRPLRLFPTVIDCFMVVFNLSRVFLDDVHFLRSDAGYWEDQSVIDDFLLNSVGLRKTFKPKDVVACFEIVGIASLLVLMVIHIISSFRDKCEFVRWLSVARIFREIIPEMKIFSAMRLLCHVTPYVMIREFKQNLGDLSDRRDEGEKVSRLVLDLMFFVLSRIVIAAIGFSAFVVRFKVVQQHIGVVAFGSICKSLLFLHQTMGIVQVERVSTQRVALFVFGGEDTYISAGEDRVMLAWWAKLHQRIWTIPSSGPLQAFAMSMSFNDQDFQRLMLNERQVEGLEHIRASRSWSRVKTAPALGSAGTGPLQKTTKIVMPAPVHPTHDPDKLL